MLRIKRIFLILLCFKSNSTKYIDYQHLNFHILYGVIINYFINMLIISKVHLFNIIEREFSAHFKMYYICIGLCYEK